MIFSHCIQTTPGLMYFFCSIFCRRGIAPNVVSNKLLWLLGVSPELYFSSTWHNSLPKVDAFGNFYKGVSLNGGTPKTPQKDDF